MITFSQAQSESDLRGILQLQRENLAINLSPSEAASQGFVTVVHTYDQLQDLNLLEKHVIAKEADVVIGYILAMTPASRATIPVLVPMFEVFDEIRYKAKSLREFPYIVVGQVCIDKKYRGKGLFAQCYSAYRDHYSKSYSLAITEIATVNTRSLKAHQRIGFETVHTYTAPDGVAWDIVIWNWQHGDKC